MKRRPDLSALLAIEPPAFLDALVLERAHRVLPRPKQRKLALRVTEQARRDAPPTLTPADYATCPGSEFGTRR